MSKLLTIARTEFVKYIRKPSFWFTMLLLPVMMVVISIMGGNDSSSSSSIPGMEIAQEAQSDPTVLRLGVVDQSGLISGIPAGFPPQTADLYRYFANESDAKAALIAEDILSYYIIPADYVQKGVVYRYSTEVDPFGGALQEQLVELLLITSMSPDQDPFAARASLAPLAGLSVESLNATSPDQARNAEEKEQEAFQIGFAFALLLYMSIFISASWLLQALIEEKENRVIEVVLSSVTPRTLLLGKTLGLGLLGLFEVIVWIGFGVVFLSRGSSVVSSLATVSISPGIMLLMLLCFILGYLMYASLMAGIGAVANTMRESSQLTVVMAVPIIIPLLFLSVIISQPNGVMAQAMTYFPLTAPIVLVVRAAIISIPLWQVVLSIGLMIAMIVFLQILAARMFRASNLLSGTKPSLKGMLQALRS